MRSTLPALTGPRVHRLIRLVLLGLSVGVVLGKSAPGSHLLWAVGLAGLGILASRPSRQPWVVATTSAEGLLVGVAVSATGFADSPYLPYLIAPAFTGALIARVFDGVLPVGVAATVLLAVALLDPETSLREDVSSDLAQWVVLALLVAVVASWVRSVLREAERAKPDVNAALQEAYRLLTELRSVARELPGTLDPATAAESMLERARDVARFDIGAVLVAPVGSRQLNVMARLGAARPPWDLSIDDGSPLAGAWGSQTAQAFASHLPRSDGTTQAGSALVAPLVSGGRTFGLVLLESNVAQGFPPETVGRVAERVGELALQLQTGLVFDEVRELATAEERRRLSREIHDGIAQELASVAYALDTAATDLEPGHAAAAQVHAIRDEVRRLVTELRMSLFDLRSEVSPDEGLGAAIGRYVRAVGAASGLTVHLSLNEGPLRLSAETEAELLRIVQEAVANARRHAHAQNLWVSCTVDPPTAAVSIEDDGRGLLGEASEDNHGLEIMRERAARVRGELVVAPRKPRGTSVHVVIGKVRT